MAALPHDPQTKTSELYYLGIACTKFLYMMLFSCLMLPGNSIRPLKTQEIMQAFQFNKRHPALHVRLERFY